MVPKRREGAPERLVESRRVLASLVQYSALCAGDQRIYQQVVALLKATTARLTMGSVPTMNGMESRLYIHFPWRMCSIEGFHTAYVVLPRSYSALLCQLRAMLRGARPCNGCCCTGSKPRASQCGRAPAHILRRMHTYPAQWWAVYERDAEEVEA